MVVPRASWVSSSHGAALPPGREGPPVVPPGPTLRARYGTTAVRAEIIAPSITAHSRPPFDLLVLLLAYTGIRIGEAMALRRDDVLDYGRLLMIDERKAEPDGRLDYDRPKAHQIRHVVLPDFLAERIRDHVVRHVAPQPKAHLFTNRDGGALRYGSWRRWQFDPAVRAAGLQDVTPHDLRATHGGWVADAHGVMAAARRLGHSNANVRRGTTCEPSTAMTPCSLLP